MCPVVLLVLFFLFFFFCWGGGGGGVGVNHCWCSGLSELFLVWVNVYFSFHRNDNLAV